MKSGSRASVLLALVDLQQVSVTLDDVLDDAGVLHGAQVSQTLGVLLHHLPQHPPHDLPRARLRQPLDKLPQDGSKQHEVQFDMCDPW